MRSEYIKSHGKEILRDYRQHKTLQKVLSFLQKLLSKVLLTSSISLFLLAGTFSAQVIIMGLAHQL